MQTQNVNPIQEAGTSTQLPIEYLPHSGVPSNAMLIDQSNQLQHLHGIRHNGNIAPPAYCGTFFNVELLDQASWKAFYDVGNEMIITKCGRRTFPYFSVRISGLIPHVKYSVQVGIEQINPIRWKYIEGKGWSPSKHEVYDSQCHYMEHTDSGKAGELLEGKVLTFKYIKLTNHPTGKDNHFLLKSMHLYNFRVIISAILPGNMYCVVHNNTFDQTCFFAVTAYQNKLITRLKIERNPYAKGFLTQDRAKPHSGTDSKDNRKIRVSESDIDAAFSTTASIVSNATGTHMDAVPTTIPAHQPNTNVDYINSNVNFIPSNIGIVDFKDINNSGEFLTSNGTHLNSGAMAGINFMLNPTQNTNFDFAVNNRTADLIPFSDFSQLPPQTSETGLSEESHNNSSRHSQMCRTPNSCGYTTTTSTVNYYGQQQDSNGYTVDEEQNTNNDKQ